MSVTLCYSTARPSPELSWFFDSLKHNSHLEEIGQIIICDLYAEEFAGWSAEDARQSVIRACDAAGKFASITQVVPPKPNVWAGRYRLTPRNWWAKPDFLNTCICYARGSYLVFLDDRCALEPTFMDAVHEAAANNYCVAGVYSKQVGMVVRDGKIISLGKTMATDSRMEGETDLNRRRPCPGEWMFGCAFGVPLEYALRVNGVDESWSGVSMEDTHFGKMLENNGFPIYHDGRMKMVEDRTPFEQDPNCREHDMKRSSKEKHPHDHNDKTWTLKRKLWGNKASVHPWNMREIRESVLHGNAFPIPRTPTHDFFDSQPLSEMT